MSKILEILAFLSKQDLPNFVVVVVVVVAQSSKECRSLKRRYELVF